MGTLSRGSNSVIFTFASLLDGDRKNLLTVQKNFLRSKFHFRTLNWKGSSRFVHEFIEIVNLGKMVEKHGELCSENG